MSILTKSLAITPSDVADLPQKIKKLYVGGGGTVKLELYNDTAAVTITVPTGGSLDGLLIKKIWSTGTSATLLVGFYGG